MALTTAVLIAAILCLLQFSDAAKEGAREGLQLCEEIIIPSLLPIMILSNTLLRTGSSVLEKLFGGITEKVFRLPRAATGAIILGLTCGYPTGCMLTATLYQSGRISRSEALRMLRFNVCGGAAFIITAVGKMTLCSAAAGILLLSANITAALLFALVQGFFYRHTPLSASDTAGAMPIATALPSATEATVRGLAVMSAFIVFFSSLIAIAPIPEQLLPLLEITKGLCQSAVTPSLPYYAFFLSFGGLCIHLQLAHYLSAMQIRYLDFLTGRITCALLSLGIGTLLTQLFPQSTAVFSNLAAPQSALTEGSGALSAVMLVGCAVFIFDLQNRKLKLTG